jgi:hypothetical protein
LYLLYFLCFTCDAGLDNLADNPESAATAAWSAAT